jgi:hypothetical protein
MQREDSTPPPAQKRKPETEREGWLSPETIAEWFQPQVYFIDDSRPPSFPWESDSEEEDLPSLETAIEWLQPSTPSEVEGIEALPAPTELPRASAEEMRRCDDASLVPPKTGWVAALPPLQAGAPPQPCTPVDGGAKARATVAASPSPQQEAASVLAGVPFFSSWAEIERWMQSTPAMDAAEVAARATPPSPTEGRSNQPRIGAAAAAPRDAKRKRAENASAAGATAAREAKRARVVSRQ